MSFLHGDIPTPVRTILTPGILPLEAKRYLHRHPVIGVYKFYENWSTETLRNSDKRRSATAFRRWNQIA
jgi:hypothetical protein